MRFRLLLCTLFLLLLASIGGGVWLFQHRKPDPMIHAAARAQQGDMREILLLQRDAAASHPDDVGARVRVGQTLLKLGDGVSAEKSFRSIVEHGTAQGPDRWAALQGLGEADLMQGNWKAVLADVPASGPDAAVTGPFLLLRATAQLALDDVAGAKATQAAASATAPDRPEPAMIAARLALKAGDATAAEAAADAALRLDPNNIDALSLKLRLASVKPDPAPALAVADRAIAAAPWLLSLRIDRANLLMRMPGQDAKAQEDVDVVLSRAPGIAAARYLNAVLMARGGRLAEASAALERLGPAVERFPRGLYIQAVVNSMLGNAETAMTLAERYSARFPGDRDGFMLLARTRIAAGHADLALPQLTGRIAAAKAANVPVDPALLILLGEAYSRTGNEPAALQVRQEAASLAPGSPAALTSLGLSQLRQGDISAGLDTLDRSASLAAPSAALSDQLFRAAISAGDMERAANVLTRRRAQEGETPETGIMSAMMQVANGDMDGARQGLEAVIRASPNTLVAKVDLAQILLAQGRTAEGQAQLNEVLAKEPGNLAALTAQLRIWLAAKQFDEALRAVAAAKAAVPNDPRYLAMQADVMIRSGDPKGALTMLGALQASGTLAPGLLPVLAQAQAAAGQEDAALATYRTVLSANPTELEARSAQVGLLVRAKRMDEAKASVRDGLARAPGAYGLQRALVLLEESTSGLDAALKLAAELRARTDTMPAAALLQGDLLVGAKQFDRAADAYQAEFNQSPSQVLALRLAAADAGAGRWDAAATVLRNWLAAHPDSPEVSGVLARLDERAGRFELAVGELETRLQHRPNDPAALNDLAWIYQTHNDPRALSLAQRAYQLAPLPQIADTLGWVMLQRGDIKPAVELLKRAVAARPDDPSLTYHLALALDKSGQAEDGRKLLEPLLAKTDAFDDRAAAEKLLAQMKGQ
jgi:putative PEP-CTERM system TPR-repeat lipoprotein